MFKFWIINKGHNPTRAAPALVVVPGWRCAVRALWACPVRRRGGAEPTSPSGARAQCGALNRDLACWYGTPRRLILTLHTQHGILKLRPRVAHTGVGSGGL